MTHLSPTATAPLAPAHPTRRYFLLFASVLLLSFAIQFPIVYNFQFFAFYDPGTAFHALDLLAKHYTPTVDFGYTHGLLSLEFSRLWFTLLGKSPLAFVAAILTLHMIIALGLARLAATFNLSRRATILFCCLLPWAVIPNYLTLTHPLEAALLIHALADHAADKRPRALALLTLTLFVKPSMAYVYGFVLTLLILRDALSRQSPLPARLGKFLLSLAPAALTAFLSLSLLLLRYGITPVKNTLFAVAGASAYRDTNFGLFFGDGRDFWLPSHPPQLTPLTLLNFPLYYLLNPATIWIIATLSLTLAGIYSLPRLLSPSPSGSRTLDTGHFKELLPTLALLHTSFLLLFYGWEQSWTYYAYMPFFALPLIISKFNIQRRIWITLVSLALASHGMSALTALSCWFANTRTPETSGLFAWNNHAQSYREVLAQTAGSKTLLLTNGYPFYLPPNVSIPDAWFPESGIATDLEVARVRQQALSSRYIIIFHWYGKADLWNTPKFSDVRPLFHPIPLTPRTFPNDSDKSNPCQNSHFEIWEKNPTSPTSIDSPSNNPANE